MTARYEPTRSDPIMKSPMLQRPASAASMRWVSSHKAYNGGECLMRFLQTDDMAGFRDDGQFEAFAMALLHQMAIFNRSG